MPKYEMMYIVASSVSDDQIPSVTDGILNLLPGLGATDIKEEKLGKKKLAYPIKKTRNGFYTVVSFEIQPQKIAELNKKMQTDENITRYIIVNTEDDMIRTKKDKIAQEKMNKNRAEHAPALKVAPKEEQAAPVSEQNIDEKIEKALSEDLSKI